MSPLRGGCRARRGCRCRASSCCCLGCGGFGTDDDLAGVAAREELERVGITVEPDLGRDERAEVDGAALEEPPGAVPRLPYLPAAHGRHVEVLEDQRLGDVD